MDLSQRIAGQFLDSARLHAESAELLAPAIAAAAAMVVEALLAEKKVLCCGNGGAALLVQNFAGHMLNRLELERPGLAAVALSADSGTITAIADDSDYALVFSRQILALGQPGDVLLAASLGGSSPSVLKAISAAHERGMQVIAISGGDGGALMELLHPADIHMGVPHESLARVQELGMLALHCLCDSVDCILLGVE